jgi:uncharacterized protein YggE
MPAQYPESFAHPLMEIVAMRIFAAAVTPAVALLLALQLPATAQESPRIAELVVTGEGIVIARPDIATVTIGVVSEAANARAALDANNADMRNVVSSVRTAGVEERDIGTTGFNVEPVYSRPPLRPDGSQENPQIVGYRVSNQVSVRIRNIDNSGAVLDAVVSAGANRVTGIEFGIAEPGRLNDEALRNAIADARRKADLMAHAAGVRLVRILSISTNAPFPRPEFDMRLAAAPAKDVPILQGERTLSATASIVYEIAPL